MRKLLLLFFCFAGVAHAACSGSGTTWSCPAGATNTDVQNAINAGSDGMVITQANGSATWTGTVNMPTTKGFTYICATVGGCTITDSSMGFQMTGLPSGTLNSLIRISGFVWNSPTRIMWPCSAGGCHNGTIAALRIDHITYTSSGSQFFLFGDNTSTNIFVYGVMDHNNITEAGSGVIFEFISTLNSSSPATATGLGQSTNMFLEDNTITVTSPTLSGVGCTDGWGGAFSVVARHNTATNCRWLTHGVDDGGGPRNFEVYNNSATWTSNNSGLGSGSTGIQNCYRAYHNQGAGTGMAFNNSCTPFSTVSGDAIVIQNFRSACPNSGGEGNGQACCDGTQSGATYNGTTYTNVTDGNRVGEHGYPCWHQITRDDSLVMHTFGMWNNTTTGGVLLGGGFDDIGGSPDNSPFQVVNGRDYVKAGAQQIDSTHPFNGSSGMGWGQLSFRPSNCTKSTDSGDVGGTSYFATDSGPQGTMFACSVSGSPGTWTAVYSPYTYPHPLVSGAGTPAATITCPSACPSFNYGSLASGQVLNQTYTITNTGTASLVTNPSGGLSDTVNYQVVDSLACIANTYAPGASCNFVIRFKPQGNGSFPATFTLDSNASPAVVSLSGTGLQVSTPTFAPGGGTYFSPQSVTLSTSTPSATICYRLDGGTPTAGTPGTCDSSGGQEFTYSTPIGISSNTTITAIGTLSGFGNSTVGTAVYTFSIAPVLIIPQVGMFGN